MSRYEKYTEQESEVNLSDVSEGMPLTVIGSKAFLSCKTVERLVLPSTVEFVEDWSFAHMKNLKEIVMPARTVQFGKQVFLGCDSLKRVVLYSVDGTAEAVTLQEMEGLEKLRASMFRFFPQESLERLEDFVEEEGQRGWLARYDEALEIFLCKSDDCGFEPAFIGWFDVEDVDDQRQGYIINRRKDKIALVFQRLTCGEAPREQLLGCLHSVIVRHSELVKDLLTENPEYGRDIRYYKIWQQAGGLERPMVESFLKSSPWEEPEVRTYLMELLQADKADFFEELEL